MSHIIFQQKQASIFRVEKEISERPKLRRRDSARTS